MSDENSKPKRQSVKNALEKIRKKAWKTTLARLTLKECTIPAIWIWAWDDASSGRYQITEMHRPTELPEEYCVFDASTNLRWGTLSSTGT